MKVEMNLMIAKSYRRFLKNYRTLNGDINFYPDFDYDLNELLRYIGYYVRQYERSFEDCFKADLDEPIWDCNWEPPIEEDEDDDI